MIYPLDYRFDTFRYRDGYILDFVWTLDTFEIWLYHEDNMVKMFCFGIDSDRMSFREFQDTYLDSNVIEPYISLYDRDFKD